MKNHAAVMYHRIGNVHMSMPDPMDLRQVSGQPEKIPTSAVVFLSMASPGEARAENGEPIRVQQQRAIAMKRASELDIEIVEEFVEVGVAALDHRKRPTLKAMLTYVDEHPDVGYAIFPGLHRISRDGQDFERTVECFRARGVDISTFAVTRPRPARLPGLP